MATMWVVGPMSFYVLRVLLGLAEAGFFPGMVLYLTYWIPARAAREDGRAVHDRRPRGDDDRGAGLGGACSSSTAWAASTAGSGCSWSKASPP